MNKVIDIEKLRRNVDTMINTLEWDAMRSPGKTKQNCQDLVALYALKTRYAKTNTPKKEV